MNRSEGMKLHFYGQVSCTIKCIFDSECTYCLADAAGYF